MSHVSTVILKVSSLDGERTEYAREVVGIAGKTGLAPIEAIQAWLDERSKGQLAEVSAAGGGNKGAEGYVYLGGFNYLNVEEFAHLVGTLPWVFTEQVALVVNTEGGRTRLFRIKADETGIEEFLQ